MNKNNVQVWEYFNRLVRLPNQVISKTGSIIYYKMNEISIDGTSVMT